MATYAECVEMMSARVERFAEEMDELRRIVRRAGGRLVSAHLTAYGDIDDDEIDYEDEPVMEEVP